MLNNTSPLAVVEGRQLPTAGVSFDQCTFEVSGNSRKSFDGNVRLSMMFVSHADAAIWILFSNCPLLFPFQANNVDSNLIRGVRAAINVSSSTFASNNAVVSSCGLGLVYAVALVCATMGNKVVCRLHNRPIPAMPRTFAHCVSHRLVLFFLFSMVSRAPSSEPRMPM